MYQTAQNQEMRGDTAPCITGAYDTGANLSRWLLIVSQKMSRLLRTTAISTLGLPANMAKLLIAKARTVLAKANDLNGPSLRANHTLDIARISGNFVKDVTDYMTGAGFLHGTKATTAYIKNCVNSATENLRLTR